MKIKYERYQLKPEAYPELTPESRAQINNDIPLICERNVAMGYQQGLKRGMLIGGLAAFTGCAIGVALKVRQEKKLNKVEVVKTKKKD